MSNINLVQFSTEQFNEEIRNGILKAFNEIKESLKPEAPAEYFTRNEVAEYLSVDLSTVHNYSKRGILQPYAVGSRVYYKRSEIEQVFVKLNN